MPTGARLMEGGQEFKVSLNYLRAFVPEVSLPLESLFSCEVRFLSLFCPDQMLPGQEDPVENSFV